VRGGRDFVGDAEVVARSSDGPQPRPRRGAHDQGCEVITLLRPCLGANVRFFCGLILLPSVDTQLVTEGPIAKLLWQVVVLAGCRS
jgi:hypothetical protein